MLTLKASVKRRSVLSDMESMNLFFLLLSDMTDATNGINLYLFEFGALIKFSHGERILTTI